MKEEQRELQRKLRVLAHARKTGNIRMTCHYFGVAGPLCSGGKAPMRNVTSPGWSINRRPPPPSKTALPGGDR